MKRVSTTYLVHPRDHLHHSPHPTSQSSDLDEPPSAELEGERISHASFDVVLTSAEADVTEVSRRDEDARKRLRKLRYASELEHKGLEQICREHSPRAAQVEPYDPGDEADVLPASGSVEDIGKRPKYQSRIAQKICSARTLESAHQTRERASNTRSAHTKRDLEDSVHFSALYVLLFLLY